MKLLKVTFLAPVVLCLLLFISVKSYAQAPTISYAPSTSTFTSGTAITPLTPTLGGGPADSYSSDPLPTGLSIDPATGIISGTPTVVTAANTYTVTAISAANGNGTTTITLTVNPAAPAISYNSPNTFVAGTGITSLSPSSTGGAIDTYSISPALPAGLSFDTSTGIISGTPTTVTAAADYTVTATNVTDVATFPVNITVNPALPAITYNTPNTFVSGTAITALNPASTGGAVDTYAISPALPAGLSFDTSTGIISGTPTAVTAAADYTVTATNVTGTATFAVNITVNPALPAITYNTPNIFTYGSAISTLSPANTGGAAASYAISPALPAGLSLSTSTGDVTGTPTAATAAADYTVTATNVTGISTFAVNITVNKAVLTVTPDDQTKVYGTANPALTIGYSGFVSGDTPGSINTLPTATTAATAISPVTTYPITASGGLDNNYSFNYVAGTLTITQANLTVTATGPNKIYGQALTAGATSSNWSASGTVLGETVTSVTLTPDGAGLSATTAAGSGYVVTPSAPTGSGGFLASNYSITFNNYNGTVLQAPLTVTATGPTKTYGTALTAGPTGANWTATGAVAGQTVTSVTLTPDAAGLSATTAAGSGYVVTPSAPTGTGGFLASNYTIIFNDYNGTVATKALTITATGPAKTYGTALTAGPTGANWTATGAIAGQTVTSVTLTPDAAGLSATTAAGSAYVVSQSAPTGTGGFLASNYTITFNDFNGTVAAKALTITATGPAKTYGTALTAGPTASDWTATGAIAGETVTSVTLTPNAAGLSATTAAGSAYVVTPSAPTGTGGFLASNYAITFNNFNGTVGKAALIVTATGPTKTYGTALTAGATGANWTATGEVGAENVTSVTLTPNAAGLSATTTAGSAYVVVPSAPTGTGGFLASNYNITFNNYNGTVAAKALTVTATGPTKTYGTALTAGATGANWTATGMVAGQNVTSVTLTPNAAGLSATTAAGSAYVVTPSAPTGTGGFLASNYTITFNPYNGTVAAKALVVTATGPTKTYGTALTAGATGANWTATGEVGAENVTSVTLTPNASGLSATTAAGSAYVVVPSAPTGTGGFLASNYTITFNNYNGTVAKAALTVTATGPTKTYGTALTTGPTASNWTATGEIGAENVTSVTLTPNAAGLSATTAAGSAYIVVPSAPTGTGGFLASNYTITFNNYNGTVAKAALIVTATGPTKTYGTALTAGATGANWTATGEVGAENVTSVTLTPNAAGLSATTAAGSAYVVVPSAPTGTGGFLASNYNITFNNYNGTVAAKALTVTATGPTKTYGTALTAGATGANWTATGMVAGQNVTSVTLTPNAAGLSAATTAGSAYVVTPSAPTGTGGFLASNYSITFNPYNGTVAKATLTVTPANQTRAYGSANPAFPINYTGFVNGETIAVINTAPTAATTATTTSNAGTYNITASGGVDDNYAFNYVNGTLTVTQVLLTVTANNQTKIQGSANPALTFVITGFVNGDTQAVINTQPTATTTATTGSGVGTYPITVSGGADNNYTFTYNPGTLTVNPQLPAFTYITPQSISVGTTVSLAPTNTGGAVASYAISPTGLPAGLSFSTTTGIISGTPTAATAGANFIVTGTNVTGSGNFTINITVTATGSNAFDWTGAASTAWNNPLNWQVNGVQQTTVFPGSVSTTDVVRVGVSTSIATFTNQPLLSTSNETIASLTFGNNNAAVNNNTGGIINLTVNGFTLAVTGAIVQNHSNTGGNDGLFAVDPGVTTTLQGTGSITCASITVGDNTTLPSNGLEMCVTRLNIGSTTASTLSVTVAGDLTLNSSSTAGNNLITQGNNAYVSFAAGTLNIGGTIREVTGSPTAFYFIGTYAPSAQFSIDLNNTNTPVLNLSGATPVNIGTNANNSTTNQVDFYNPTATPHKASTVNYTGASQRVYNYNTSTTMNTQFDNNGEANGDGYVYQNIGFSGSGTKTLDAGTFKVNGTFTLSPGTETVTLATNNPTLTVAGNFSTGLNATFTNGTNPVTIGGGFNNDGTTTFGTPLVTFNSAAAAAFTGTAPVTLTNVAFSGGGAKNMTSGTFNVASTGVLTMSGNTALAAGGFLTLKSDPTGSATVANVPAGCSITGNVNVQRYIKAARAYRLISSPVYSASVTSGGNTFKDYSLNYVQLTSYLTGTTGTAGGFDKGVNPTLYLYRENLAPQFTTFLNSNYRGINNILSAPSYNMDVDPGTYNIPTGNGFLFFYRGDRSVADLATETTVGYAATAGTLTATGTLNVGNVAVTDWYNPGAVGLGYTTTSGSVNVEGSNLVGNPYASSIDWDQYTTGGITHTNVGPFAYRLIPTGAQGSGNYDVYQSNTNVGGNKQGTQGTPNSNIIVSGEGFFVFATNTGALLTFTEAAKTNTQVTGSGLYMAKRLSQFATTEQYLHIKMSMDTLNSDGTIIRFDAGAQANFNPAEDASYRVGTGKVSLSSLSSDRRSLAINQLPFVVQGQRIPLNVSATADGTYNLNLTELTGIPQLFNIWLKDNNLKDSVDMRHANSYSFSILHSDTNSYGSNRFAIVINQNPDYAYRLLNFNATKDPSVRAVQVAWKTQYEDNYTQFMVERSTDNGKTFATLGSMGSVGLGSYGLLDSRPIVGQNLYRLKQIDINGNISYSKVVLVSYSDLSNSLAKNNITLFPNPSTSNVSLAVLTDTGSGAYDIKITNSAGFVVKEATTNQPNLQLNVSGWLPGTYLVKVLNSKDQSEVGTTKLIKL